MAHLDKVIELRGTVNGCIRRDQTVSFLLTLGDKTAILLDAPTTDSRMVSEVNNQTLRVLAKVSENKHGNVVPLEVLGISYDGEVTLREKEAAAQEAASHQQVTRTSSRASSPKFTSRGTYGGQSQNITPFDPSEVSDLARQSLSPEAQAIYPVYRSFIYKCNKRLTAKELDDITVGVLYFSAKHRVDPRLVCAMIIAESDFNPRSTSNKGAMGLGQVMPDEARDHRLTNPYDPIQNVRASVNLLKMKLNLYNEGAPEGQLTLRQVQLALAAYNAGAGAVKKYGGIPPYKETQGYVKRILKLYNELCGH
jgi:soluble lytic murein transglycosylase-like protein